MVQNQIIENTAIEMKTKLSTGIKKYTFDLISVGITLAIIAASLNALGFYDFTSENAWSELGSFFADWIPYFMAAILLNNNMYRKGVFTGKNNESYINTVLYYSEIVQNMTGEQIKGLDDFCTKINDETIRNMQENILKKEGILLEDFEKEHKYKDKIFPPLKTMTKKQLLMLYNKEQVKCIIKAKKVKISGLSTNKLLSSLTVNDRTNLGKTETELNRDYTWQSTIMSIISTLATALIVVKDIQNWGWTGLIVVLFKVSYVFTKSYIGYFKGYNDIVIDAKENIARKSDTLKVYLDDMKITTENLTENLQQENEIKSNNLVENII